MSIVPVFLISKKQSLVFLLHRHRLGQVPGLIDVAALHAGHIVGEELQGDDGEAGQHEVRDLGHAELVVRLLL